jgi:probable phosphoglycerate mutase
VQPFAGRGIFFLVRHGETEWNRERRVMGRLGIPLSDAGRAQVDRLIPMLAPPGIAAVWTSPLSRARETADLLARGLGDLPVHVDEDLTEVDYGAWEGRTFAELVVEPAYHAYHRDPEGAAVPGASERLSEVRDRVLGALARIAAALPGERVLVVSHGDPIRLVLAACLGLSVAEMRRLRVDTAAVSGFEATGDWAEVKFVNVRPDLDGIVGPRTERDAGEGPSA